MLCKLCYVKFIFMTLVLLKESQQTLIYRQIQYTTNLVWIACKPAGLALLLTILPLSNHGSTQYYITPSIILSVIEQHIFMEGASKSWLHSAPPESSPENFMVCAQTLSFGDFLA